MNEVKLEKAFKSRDVLAMAFGSMIGWGWIMLSGSWAIEAGMLGAILAFVFGAMMCIFVGLAYAELTPMLPCTGGSVVYAFKAMGYWPAAIAGLATSFAYLGVVALEGPAFATAIDYIVKVPKLVYLWTIEGYDVYLSWAMIAIVCAIILTWINYRGAQMAAVFQTAATLCIIAIGLLFAFGSVINGDFENTKPYFTDTGGFMAVLLMVPAMFVGFDVIPQCAGEMNMPRKKIPGLLIVSIIAAAFWYMLMIFATCMSAPQSVRVTGTVPVADCMAYAFGSAVWGKVCIVGALCGIITSWNGFLFSAARCIYAMANARILPVGLSKLHPKYNTPYRAILLCGAISFCSIFVGSGALAWFVNASSFGVVIMYLMAVLAFIVLRKRRPNLDRPYKIKVFVPVAILSLITVVFFTYLYLPMGPSSLVKVEWYMVLAWFILGLFVAAYCKMKYKDVTDAQREDLLMKNNCSRV